MALVHSIYERPIPPNPATSTIEDRRKFIVQWTQAYTRDLAVENLLDPLQPDPQLPELPDQEEPMPGHLAAFWDGLTDLERTRMKGGRIWRLPAAEHWQRIAYCVDVFRAHGLPLRDAISMCRFPDGLGAHKEHARILQQVWRMRESGDPGNRRWTEHLSAIVGIGALCDAPAQEIALIAEKEWNAAEAEAVRWLEALRRRLWPMCRSEMPEKAVLAAADEVSERFNLFVPDDLLFPVLRSIERGARPTRRRRRG